MNRHVFRLNIMMDTSIILSIFLGVGLFAAVEFRVFMPLIALSVANYFGVVPLG
ncbi:MAG: hypothetical protein ACI9O4_000218 [Chitinophagales bacterium]|jgi:hypothetical protein